MGSKTVAAGRGESPHGGRPATSLPALARASIWAAYREERRHGTDKLTKPPRNPMKGSYAKANDPTTWGKRRTAERRADAFRNGAEGARTGIGIMLAPLPDHPGWRLCGVDLDGRDPETGELARWAKPVLARLRSYAEASPSGAGVHLLFLCEDVDVETLRARGLLENVGRSFSLPGEHVEISIFFERKFLTVTGDVLSADDTIRAASLADLQWLLDHGRKCRFDQGRGGGVHGTSAQGGGGGDDSGSGHGFKFACDRMREGLDDDAVREAFAEDDGEAGEWWGRCGNHQQGRAIENARRRIGEEHDKIIALFPDMSDGDYDAGVDGEPEPEPGAAKAKAAGWTFELFIPPTCRPKRPS